MERSPDLLPLDLLPRISILETIRSNSVTRVASGVMLGITKPADRDRSIDGSQLPTMKLAARSDTLRRVACTRLPTKWGTVQALGFQREIRNGTQRTETAVALLLGEMTGNAPLVRIHSQCLTADVLGSLRCDCGDQLDLAMRAIAGEGSGLLIYEHQEGRGIGLMAKLQAYSLQDMGLDTVEANHVLGFRSDYRDYALPIAVLHDLGIARVRLLSNNPDKACALRDAGIEVVEQVRCEVSVNLHSSTYLQTKRDKMGHALRLVEAASAEAVVHAPAAGPGPSAESRSVLTREQVAFASIEEAFLELAAGRIIVVVDDEDRENEGDLLMAAEMVTPEAINFMATHGRGLICLAMTGERLDELKLAPMTLENTALCGTGFAVSIDVKGRGVTTGISAYDRAQTIRAAVDVGSRPEDFARPGHVFPLRCRAGGILERRGHTEAAVDLARLAGLHSSGVICEILQDDGTMARLPELVRFCMMHELRMITVAELERYRLAFDPTITKSQAAPEIEISSARVRRT
jgi:3,4-dihydroxy-2-butanone 4-phosphate synthase/GTP cyclohydrolase II